jgi:hypothetical protein
MIDVSLSQIVLICFGLGVVLVSITWFITVTRVRHAEKKRVKDVITCRICSVRYEAEPAATSPCPACGTPNELDPPNII